MPLSPGWTFLALLLFFNTARSYVFENVTLDRDMFWAQLAGRADEPHGKQAMQVEEVKHRIVAVGDVHGSLGNLKGVLRMAGVTDMADKWRKSESTDVRQKWQEPPDYLVQVGDIMDKGKHVKGVFEFFDELRSQAPEKIFTLFGNHEWMNLIGDWSAINKEELKTDYEDDVPTRYQEIYQGNIGKSLKMHFIAALRLPLHPLAGKPNQPYDPATKDKSPLSHAALAFVHAGFSLKHRTLLDRFPETINRVSASLLETMQNWYPTPIAYPYELGEKPRSPPFKMDINQTALLDRENGPLWYRGWGEPPEKLDCSEIEELLGVIGARRVIVGHNKGPDIRHMCDGRLILIDAGMCAGNRAALSVEYSFSKGKELEIITAITRDPLTKKVHRIPVVKYERDITA